MKFLLPLFFEALGQKCGLIFLQGMRKGALIILQGVPQHFEDFFCIFFINHWDFLGPQDPGILSDRRISTDIGSLDLSNYVNVRMSRIITYTRDTLFSDKFTHFWLAGRRVGSAAVPVTSDALSRDILS